MYNFLMSILHSHRASLEWTVLESNQLHEDFQSSALPVELTVLTKMTKITFHFNYFLSLSYIYIISKIF